MPAMTASFWLPRSFEELLDAYQTELTGEVLRRMPPVYGLNGSPQDPEVARLLRRPFPAQYHAAKALATYLRDHRAAQLVGEPSIGKTITSLVVAALLRVRRVLVVAPTHLLPKWRREIQTTLPGAGAVELRRLCDLPPAFPRSPTPARPIFLLLSRDQGKLGAPWRHVAHQHYLRREEDPARLPRRVPVIEGAESLPGLLVDGDGAPVLAFSCPRCGALLRDEPTAEQAKLGRARRLWTGADFGAAPRACPFCREPLVQQSRLPGSGRGVYPIARYLARHYRGTCDLLILDEVHQYKARDSAQGMMLSELGRVAPRTLALTATLMNGRATSLFYLLHRLGPEFRRKWAYHEARRFARTYGLHEVTRYDGEDEHEQVTARGKRSRRRTVQTVTRELPGVSPLLLHHVLDRTVVFQLRDLGLALPPYREQAIEVALTPAQAEAYARFLADIQGHLAHGYRHRMLRFLGASLQVLLSWPDAPWRGEAIVPPRTEEILATLPALPAESVYPKEAMLVSLCRESKSQGRRVLVYCTHTRTRDITRRLQRLLAEAGLRAEILASGVAGRTREAWIDRHAPALDVMITHPKLVGEGLDLIQFPDVVWMEPEYSTYAVRQASRRTWRIGQTEPVVVRFLVYSDTLQQHALGIVAKGIRAASMIDGEVLMDETLAEYGATEFFLELARMVVERASTPDADALLRAAAARESADHTLVLPESAADDGGAAEAPRIRDVTLTRRPEQLPLFSA
jgi:hypothetical protein